MRRKTTHERKVKEMLETRVKQVDESKKEALKEKEADQRQLEIFQKNLADGKEEDRKKAEKARQARADLDVHLIGQIRDQTAVHPLRFGMTDKTRQTDLAYNRLLFEEMNMQGFRQELSAEMLAKATDKGKIQYCGS